MIAGDPNNFAIMIEPIEEWSNPELHWLEGVFDFIFQGKYLSEKIYSYTFNDIFSRKDIPEFFSSEKDIIEDKQIFEMDKNSAFKVMIDNFNPYILDKECEIEEWDQTYKYFLPPDDMNSFGIYTVVVRHKNMARILGAKLNDLITKIDGEKEWKPRDNFIIHEAFLEVEELNNIKKAISSYANHLLDRIYKLR